MDEIVIRVLAAALAELARRCVEYLYRRFIDPDKPGTGPR